MAENESKDRRKGVAQPECATIAIGTVPHTDPGEAVDFMIRHLPECPTWPQMPKADFHEGMYIQYAEGMPAVVIDTGRERIYFDSERAPEEMADFYESYLEGDIGQCAISADYARAFDLFLERLPIDRAKFIKGQVTGPASFGLTVTDENNKPVLYNDDLFQAIVKVLALKGRWQVEYFRRAAPELTPIIFYDEPYLTQVGSALISLPEEQVVSMLNECFQEIDGLRGIHVCGGTDWGIITKTNVDILHFDAADHSQEFLLYEKELASFLKQGGMLAWGAVPTDQRSFDMNAQEIAAAVVKNAEIISGFTGNSYSVEDILKNSFISQACGTGTLEPDLAERCFSLASDVSHELRG